jgi:hypothetical protein
MTLKKNVFSTQSAESLGTFGGDWAPAAALDISLGAQDDFAIDTDTTVLMIQPDTDVYVLIDDSPSTAITEANDLKLSGGGGEAYQIRLPKGIQQGNPSTQLHLHVKAVSSIAAQTCRVIEQ